MLANWTKATTTTTGTGTITLTAVTGYPLPSKSRVTGEYVQYSIHTSDAKFESGIGKIAASETLERSVVFSTYDGTTYNSTTASALSLASGTHDVFITPMAESVFEPLRVPFTGPTSPVTCPTNCTSSGANVAPPARERVTAFPFRLETSGILTAIAVNCSVAGTASTTLFGFYEAGANGRPERLIAKMSAAVDTSTTGAKSQSVVSNVRVTPGWYWGAYVVTAGSTTPQFTGANLTQSAFAKANGSTNALYRVYQNSTGTDLPDPFPTTSIIYSTDNNGTIPHMGLVLS